MNFQKASDVASKDHPKQIQSEVQYGTAGFRDKADKMDFIMYRMGLLAVLRSYVKQAGIGVMITASHNPEEDNGVKLIDPFGDMLEMSWESYATQLANTSDADIQSVLKSILEKCNISLESCDLSKSVVMIARDTRLSSPLMAKAVQDGIESLGGKCKDYGILTTPQLHHLVHRYNTGGKQFRDIDDYYNKLSTAFLALNKDTADKYKNKVVIDCANGVGYLSAERFRQDLADSLDIQIVNDGKNGKLNHMCGADFVKVQQKVPSVSGENPFSAGVRCTSIDGDADRLVYFYTDSSGVFHLLDGDKIATLIAGYLMELLTLSGLDLRLGLVQTAYANGSSTNYITSSLKVPVSCVKTGVKHLHHKAKDYDVGVYFEANGHGTVLFQDSALDTIDKATKDTSLTGSKLENTKKLKLVTEVINQTVGDALSDLLLVETILRSRNWTIEDWNQAYTDLPNRQLKVKVQDRRVVNTTDAERVCTTPDGLQAAIDALVCTIPNGRSFVRPSGTEDVVRVYAEASTKEQADKLAVDVATLVYNMAGGIGDKP